MATCSKVLSIWGWWDTDWGLNLEALPSTVQKKDKRAWAHHACSVETSACWCSPEAGGELRRDVCAFCKWFPTPRGAGLHSWPLTTLLPWCQTRGVEKVSWAFWETSILLEMKLKQKNTPHYAKGRWGVFMVVGYVLWLGEGIRRSGKRSLFKSAAVSLKILIN